MCINVLLPEASGHGLIAAEVAKMAWPEAGVIPVTSVGLTGLSAYQRSQELSGWILLTGLCFNAMDSAQTYAVDPRIALSIRLRINDEVTRRGVLHEGRSFIFAQFAEPAYGIDLIADFMAATTICYIDTDYGWALFQDPPTREALTAKKPTTSPQYGSSSRKTFDQATFALRLDCDIESMSRFVTSLRERPSCTNVFGLVAQ